MVKRAQMEGTRISGTGHLCAALPGSRYLQAGVYRCEPIRGRPRVVGEAKTVVTEMADIAERNEDVGAYEERCRGLCTGGAKW